MPGNSVVRAFGDDSEEEESKHGETEPKGNYLETKEGEYEISWLAFCLDEIFFSGNMPDFKTYIKYKLSQTILTVESDKSRWDKVWALGQGLPYLLLYVSDVILRGVSQVYLCNHPLCGLCICIGLWTTSSDLLLFGLVGSAVSTVAGYLISTPKQEEVEAGLCGYDGVLTANAIYTFFSLEHDEYEQPLMGTRALCLVCVLSAAAGVIHISCVNMSNLPALTFSFNIIMMCFLLAVAKQKTNIATVAWLLEADDDAVDDSVDDIDKIPANFMFFVHALFRGVGQFIFIDNSLGGAFVVLGITIASRYSGAAVLCGSIVGCINTRYILRVPPSSWMNIRNGIYGFNCAGIFAALAGDVFFNFTWGGVLMGVVGSMLVGLVSLALASFLDSDETGLPFLTLPFCLTTWFMLLTRSQHLVPKSSGDMDELLYQDNDRADRLFESGFGQRDNTDANTMADREHMGAHSVGRVKPMKSPANEGRWNDRSPRLSMVDSFRASSAPVYRSDSMRQLSAKNFGRKPVTTPVTSPAGGEPITQPNPPSQSRIHPT